MVRRCPRWFPGSSVLAVTALLSALVHGQEQPAPVGPHGVTPRGASSARWSEADLELLERLDRDGVGSLDATERRRLEFWSFHLGNLSLLFKRHDGALLVEDFEQQLPRKQDDVTLLDGRVIQQTFLGEWRLWQSDPGLAVEQLDGALAIHGRTTATGGQAYTGLVGVELGNTDVVALARVRPLQPAPEPAGRHVTLFHLCGSDPDVFHEVGFGRHGDGSVGWRHGVETLPGLARGQPPRAVSLADDAAEWTLRLEHDARSGRAQAWAYPGRQRGAPLAGTAPVPLPSSKVELKVDAPTPGVDIDTRFDDVRLYPRPENHPLRLLLVASPVLGGAPLVGWTVTLVLGEGGLGALPRPWLGGRVHRQHQATPGQVVGNGLVAVSAVTDALGRVQLVLPAELDYPASARVRVSLPDDGPTWEWVVRASGVEGVYPDDSWVLRLNASELRGDNSWWKPAERDTRLP